MTLKKCTKCKLEKPLEDFGKKSKDRLRSSCKICTRKKIREHYNNNKEYYLKKSVKNNKRYKIINKQFIFQYLQEHPCVDCNESDPIVLEFDHVKEKKRNISCMISQAYSLESIKKEIENCEVRCANCHRRKTAKQFNWNKKY